MVVLGRMGVVAAYVHGYTPRVRLQLGVHGNWIEIDKEEDEDQNQY